MRAFDVCPRGARLFLCCDVSDRRTPLLHRVVSSAAPFAVDIALPAYCFYLHALLPERFVPSVDLFDLCHITASLLPRVTGCLGYPSSRLFRLRPVISACILHIAFGFIVVCCALAPSFGLGPWLLRAVLTASPLTTSCRGSVVPLFLQFCTLCFIKRAFLYCLLTQLMLFVTCRHHSSCGHLPPHPVRSCHWMCPSCTIFCCARGGGAPADIPLLHHI